MFVLDLIYQFNSKEKLNFSRDIVFLIGQTQPAPSDSLEFSPYRTENVHWAARSIDYITAVNFLSEYPNVDFVHLKSGPNEPYHLPVLNDLSRFVSLNNSYKNGFLDMVGSSHLNMGVTEKEKPVVVFSKTIEQHRAYNTITDLYLSGYRKIYWFQNAFMQWQNKYNYLDKKFYDERHNLVDHEKASYLLQTQKDLKILDVSEAQFYNQVHFKDALLGQIVYYNTEDLKPYIKNSKSPKGQRLSTRGTYDIINADKLFPNPSKILIVTFDHYRTEYKVREMSRRLRKKGHQVFILETNTGLFLDHLRKKKSPLQKNIIEYKDTKKVFKWKS